MPKIPVEKAKMIDIVAELKMVEAAVENESEKMRDSITNRYADQILTHYGVSKTDFDTSLAVIHRHENYFKTFLVEVVQNLENRRKTDSLVLVK
ncbi:MAG: DUF4296 domain-containing protein [Saprospiraceae bacterium]|nr:DUF4296 domain-containing protein [Saprospiraceae bacterium]